MDFSSLLSSGSLLYVIGGGICVILVLMLGVIKIFSTKTASSQVISAAPADVTPSVSAASQTLTQVENVLPSTEVLDTAPLVVNTNNAATPQVEVGKGAIPPLSSWKPSQEAVTIKTEEGADVPPVTIEESIESPSQV